MTAFKDRAQIDFLRWLSHADPTLYRVGLSEAKKRGQLGSLGWIAAVIQAVAAIGSAVMEKKKQQKVAKLQKKAQAEADAAYDEEVKAQALKDQLVATNLARARQGLGPVDARGRVIPSASLPQPSGLAPFMNTLTNPSYLPWILGGAVLITGLVIIRRK